MKKVLALVLAVVLAFGMTTVAFAATTQRVRLGFNDAGLPLGQSGAKIDTTEGGGWIKDGAFDLAETNKKIDVDRLAALSVLPKTELYIPLDTFYKGLPMTDATGASTYNVNESSLSADKILVRWNKMPTAVRDIKIYTTKLTGDTTARTYIRIRFQEELVAVRANQFDFEIYLNRAGRKEPGSTLTINGEVANEREAPLYEGDTEVMLEGRIVKATDYLREVRVGGGNDVYLNTRMFADREYYFNVRVEPKEADLDLMEKNPEIAAVYYLSQYGFTPLNGKIIEFDIYDKYYVYNKEGQYIGLTTELLPYSPVMYLSEKQIDMGGNAAEEPAGEAPAPSAPAPSNPPMGGDDAASNANDNPGTGANGLVGVAVVAGLVALAAAGASKKR